MAYDAIDAEIDERRHNMHTLSGNWRGRYECHVANAGDRLVIWSSNDSVAFFERTGMTEGTTRAVRRAPSTPFQGIRIHPQRIAAAR